MPGAHPDIMLYMGLFAGRMRLEEKGSQNGKLCSFPESDRMKTGSPQDRGLTNQNGIP
jgi:hypothetical protein